MQYPKLDLKLLRVYSKCGDTDTLDIPPFILKVRLLRYFMMASSQETLAFKVSDFNRVAATLGGFLTVFGLVSYLLKEKFYLGEACASNMFACD